MNSTRRGRKAMATSLSSSMAIRKSCLGSVETLEKDSMAMPTCSSTMKDKSFPSHLHLQRGNPEAERTSSYRVCRYKYCSLNGHHHLPSLPLRPSRRRPPQTLAEEEIVEYSPIEIYASYPSDSESGRSEGKLGHGSISDLGFDRRGDFSPPEVEALADSSPIGDNGPQYRQRAPNILPEEERREEERVDLRHQQEKDRRSSEEWMVDFALRRAVDELAPRRSRKVELLVEAFETVLPSKT